MAHNIDETTGQAAIAFQGSRDDIWHRMGQQAEPGWSVDQWAAGARLNWTAHKVPALADCTNLERIAGHKRVDGGRFLLPSHPAHVLAYVSPRHPPTHPPDRL